MNIEPLFKTCEKVCLYITSYGLIGLNNITPMVFVYFISEWNVFEPTK